MGRAGTLRLSTFRSQIVAVLTLVAVFSVIAAAPGAAVAVTPVLLGNVDPALPSSVATKVTVAANSAPVGADVAVLVRNGTAQSVDHVKVRATAEAPGGGTVARASTALLVPGTLAPGGLGIGNLRFGGADLAAGTTFSFAVTSRRAAHKRRETALEVREALLSRPMEGPVAQQMAVTVANVGTKAYSGPVTVTVMCFGEARNPAFVTTETVKKAKVAAGATTPVTVGLELLCPKYMVGASAP
jgi:hypothetical protein